MATSSKRRVGFGLALCIVLSGASLLVRAEPGQVVGRWRATGAIEDARRGAAAVTLSDGRTLISGGTASDGSPMDSVVIYELIANSFSTVGHLITARRDHSATLLEDGRVLIVGGTVDYDELSSDIELFDPASGTSTLVALMSQSRTAHAAARLADNTVLIVGGSSLDGAVLQSAEVFDPASGNSTLIWSNLQQPRAGASATTLIDGRVLVAGGHDGNTDLGTAEIFDAFSQRFALVDTQLSVPRSGHTAILLPHNNSVLIAGGTAAGAAVTTADLFLPAEFPDPYSYGTGRFGPTGAMTVARTGAVGGSAGHGYAFVAGGGSADAETFRYATIETDKDDYAPGERAIITGSGWQPGEDIALIFQEDPAVHDDYRLTVTADSQGSIYWDQWAPEEHDLNVRFFLMALDSKSRAQTTFTDGLRVRVTRESPSGATISNVPSGGTVTVTFKIANVNNGPDSATTIGGTYNLSFSNLSLKSGPSASGTFSLAQNGSTQLTWSFTAPTGPSSGSINLSAAITSPTCSNTGPNTCSSGEGYTVNVLPPPDSTPPEITPTVTGDLGSNGWYTSNVGVTWTVTDPESSVSSSTGCNPSAVITDTAGVTFTCSATSAGGTQSVQLTIMRDASSPTITCTVPDGSIWYGDNVTVHCTAGDGGSGLASPGDATFSLSTTIAADSETANAQTGSHQIFDAAGNSASVGLYTFMVDRKAPILICTVPDQSIWHGDNVAVTCTATDGGSGLASAGDAAFSLSTDVAPRVETAAAASPSKPVLDAVGNTTTAGPYTFMVDRKAPNLNCTVPDQSSWHGDNVTVTCTASDEGSGLASAGHAAFSLSTDVAPAVEIAAAATPSKPVLDAVGNTTTAGPYTFMVDRKAPNLNCTVPDQSSWHGDNVTVTCTASDEGSGLASAGDAAFSLSTDVAPGVETAGAQTGSKQVLDKVGHSKTEGPYTFKIDRKGPAVTLTCPVNIILGSTASASWTANDFGSGIAAGFGSGTISGLDASSVGTKTAFAPTGTSKDNVNNSSPQVSCEYNVIYNFTGFFQPVNNPPTQNIARAGSAIPVKFSLSGNQGLNILAAYSPKWQQVVCDTWAPLEAIDETVTAGNSSLSYDSLTDQYNYVWKTDKGWAGTCRELTVKLIDGSEHHAKFKFNK